MLFNKLALLSAATMAVAPLTGAVPNKGMMNLRDDAESSHIHRLLSSKGGKSSKGGEYSKDCAKDECLTSIQKAEIFGTFLLDSIFELEEIRSEAPFSALAAINKKSAAKDEGGRRQLSRELFLEAEFKCDKYSLIGPRACPCKDEACHPPFSSFEYCVDFLGADLAIYQTFLDLGFFDPEFFEIAVIGCIAYVEECCDYPKECCDSCLKEEERCGIYELALEPFRRRKLENKDKSNGVERALHIGPEIDEPGIDEPELFCVDQIFGKDICPCKSDDAPSPTEYCEHYAPDCKGSCLEYIDKCCDGPFWLAPEPELFI